jgi:hypothetical protein
MYRMLVGNVIKLVDLCNSRRLAPLHRYPTFNCAPFSARITPLV